MADYIPKGEVINRRKRILKEEKKKTEKGRKKAKRKSYKSRSSFPQISYKQKRHVKRAVTLRSPYACHVFSYYCHIKKILHQIAGQFT